MSLKRTWMLSVGLLLTAACCGRGAESSTEQERVIAEIVKKGGKVHILENARGRPTVSVNLGNSEATDADLQHLRGLTALQELDLHSTEVTDAGFAASLSGADVTIAR